ncbi:MAG: CPBP family intramembrane metalloprotease [Saprospiraceae bacterium]|nr:CPBP family intramembrane metalloprotease [Saprospiraceae bacterium]
MSVSIRQLFVFFTLAYLISWIIWLPLYLPAFGIHLLPVLPYHHGLGGFGPMFAAFISTAIFQKKEGVASLTKSIVAWRPIIYVALALVSPFVLNLLAGGIVYLRSGHASDFSGLGISREFPDFHLLTFFLYNLIFFGFGEEVGWRGFALPRLQSKYNALTSSLFLSMFWAIWHWPLFLYRPGYVDMDVAGIFGWLFSLATGSVLLSWFFNSTRGSILVCAIFHATVDIAFTSDFSDTEIVQYTGILITIWGIATILWFKPHDLSRKMRVIMPTLLR